jgi:tetratricopeptide (TPR) repeat protein
MKKLVYTSLIIINITVQSYAQQNKIDSILTLIKADKEDTNKVNKLYKLCRQCNSLGEYDKGILCANLSLELSKNLNFKKGIANSMNALGITYKNKGNYPEGLKNFFAALKIREEIKDKQGIAGSYMGIGNIYKLQGNYVEALKNFFTSLKISKEIKDNNAIGACYNNIGTTNDDQGNYEEALKYHFKALKLREEMGDKSNIALSNINIGNIYIKQHKYTEAFKNQFAALKLFEEFENKEGITSSYLNIGVLYTKLKKIKEAEDYLNKGLQLCKVIDSKDDFMHIYGGLYDLDSIKNDFKAAFEHHKLYIIYRDSLNNEETKKKSLQASMQYEFDKKEIANKAEQDKLDAINAEEKKKQQIVIYAIAGLLVLVGVFAAFMFNRFRITNRQKVIIEKQKQTVDEAYNLLHEKNKEVMDSIRYAKRIQTALITSEKSIQNSLKRLMKNN